MPNRPKEIQAFDFEYDSLTAHLDDALEHADAELEDVLHGDGSSPKRLHELRESIRSCQDIVRVILEYDAKRKADPESSKTAS